MMMLLLAAVAATGLCWSTAASYGPDSGELWPSSSQHGAPSAAAGCMELSNAFGSHMVLQRGPEAAVVYGSVCGKLAGAKSVSVTLDGGAPITATIAPGATAWSVKLPPTPASHTPHTLKVHGGSFEATLSDVLFGDSVLCSGQSNMCFSLNQMTGATAEIELAGTPKYRSIRLMTVTPTHSPQPNADLSIMQNWSVADSASVGGGAANKSFSYFSAACWVQGRHLFDRLGGAVPIGLTTSAFGGTQIHAWSGPDALAQCPQYFPPGVTNSSGDSDLWNAMIVPLLKMRYKYMVWLQSESDVCASDDKCKPQRGAKYYTCAIQAMIKDWRAKFELPLPFLWVQISPWEGHEAATTSRQLPDMRLAQMAANKQPLTAVATAVDLGPPATANGWDSGDEHGKDPWGNVHFRNKGPLGPRLSAAAMNIVYGNQSVPYQGPLAETASAVLQDGAAAAIASASSCEARRAAAAVTVTFAKGTTGQGLEWVPRECPYLVLKERAHEKTENPDCRHSIDDCIKKCAWFDIELGKGQWVANATAAIVGTTITVTPPAHAESCALLEAEGAAPTGVRYLYGDWPVATLYSKVDDEAERLPALPFVLQL